MTLNPLREMKASRGKVISDKDLEILLDRSDLLGEDTHLSAGFSESVLCTEHSLNLLCLFRQRKGQN